jgi:hypothetical protein
MAADATAAPAAPAPISFADTASGPDAAMAALDAVLAGEGEGSEATPAGSEQAGSAAVAAPSEAAAGDAKPEGDKAPPETDAAAQVRKGFAKLADERQKLLELQGKARTEIATAQQWKDDAEAFKTFREDPGAFVLAHLEAEKVNALLDHIAKGTKSPEAQEIDRMKAERQRERDEATQQAQIRKVDEWKAGITKNVTDAGEKFDLVNSLGLHGDVIDVITAYYDKHTTRDEKGNVVQHAILPWETAAEYVENERAERIAKSKTYGKRAPAAPAATPAAAKDATSEGKPPAPKRTGTPTLSSVSVAETPVAASELSKDPHERERQILAELGL